MGDFSDMPPLVDSRYGAAAPMMAGPQQPGFGPSYDFLQFPGAAPSQSFSPGPPAAHPGFGHPAPWAGYDPQAGGTPMSWGSSTMSTPMLAAPAAVMPQSMGFPVSSEGWPRPLATQEDVDRSPPWRDRDDEHDRERRMVVRRPNTPLSRSVSLSSSPSSASLSSTSLSRKTSYNSYRGNAAEARKRPPREWRTDFNLSGQGLLSGLLTRGRSKSFGAGDPKVVLHPWIRHNTSKPPMFLDLRMNPATVKFRDLKDRALTDWDLFRFVCEPPLRHMRLYHPNLPWYIDVEAQNPVGVTLYDLFSAIHLCMMTAIVNADYYNVEMTTEARAHIAEEWAARCRTDEERNKGIRRVDYLMGRYIMEGIQKGKDGLWEIKSRKPTTS